MPSENEWCRCTRSKDFGWTYDPNQKAWVCTECRKPSKALYLLNGSKY